MHHLSWRNLHQPKKKTGLKSLPIIRWFFNQNKRRVILRDYQSKSFVNPFYGNQFNRPRYSKVNKIIVLISLTALLAAAIFLLKHSFFSITQINLSGLQKIASETLLTLVNQALDEKRLLLFSNRNYWLADTVGITKAIEERYSLDSVKITKKFPRSLNVNLTEKEAVLVYQAGAKTWLVDNQGKIIQEVEEGESTSTLSVVYADSPNSTVKINASVVPPATVKFLTFLQTKIPEVAKVEIAFSKLKDEEGRVVHLTTKENWQIYLDRQNDWEKQITVLATILNTKLKNGRAKLRYIDVRYENRAYFQ